MIEKMTAQEAINVLTNVDTMFGGNPYYVDRAASAQSVALSALQASNPRVLPLGEARALEPHTAVWAEIKTPAGKYVSLMEAYETVTVRKSARFWVGGWPSEELRATTPWKENG